ncbi:Ubiquitin 4, putative isoform 1 [Hibiscus syriacus]|uniref:Ubiquitin 4, putative isoform 1 n=1 Tax=Hibiscus syriacus TaxID=106335 RepID=A0A6A2XWG3_HIBSY|nr:CRIB domain-containing protein RIC7-like [Hibiscus syriacus]KAE8679938.1 Ubiquitin 4, putative isoform 1 [Hibiscus syriacus]
MRTFTAPSSSSPADASFSFDFILTLPKDPILLTPDMKGLLKGLRNLHNMFDEKEQEMQIGNPTDVKHVAHIGMDGPAASKPSWMNGFDSAQELSSQALANDLQDGDLGNHETLPPTEKHKKSRRKASIENGTDYESVKDGEKGEKHRRHRSNHSMESPGRESSSSHGRRHSNRSTKGESADVPDLPKKSRRKKSKASEGGSSSSRSKTGSLPDVGELES